MKLFSLHATVLMVGAAVLTQQPANAVTVYDNGGPLAGGNAAEISSAVSANDFLLTADTQLTGFTFWASVDDLAPSFADQFSGTIGWAIFSNDSNIPGTLLHSGHDSNVVVTSTGLLNLFNGEIVQIDVQFTGGLALDAGTYWLALREGEWGSIFGSPNDTTDIYWQRSDTQIGNAMRTDPNEANPDQWLIQFGFDGAFNLQGTLNDGNPGGGDPGNGDPGNGNPGGGTPGNGSAIPEPATATMGILGLIALGRRRR